MPAFSLFDLSLGRMAFLQRFAFLALQRRFQADFSGTGRTLAWA